MGLDSTKDKILADIKKSKDLIEKKLYDQALDQLIVALQSCLTDTNKDVLANILDLIGSICDKTNTTLDLTLDHIKSLLDHPDDWVRLESLLILKKVYPLRIKKFETLIEKIEAKLYDPDKKVRENAVLFIALILIKDSTSYVYLFSSFLRMFEDESWIVRARTLEGALNFLKNHLITTPNLIEPFQKYFIKLIEDPDEEVRGLATEALNSLFDQLQPDSYLGLLKQLLIDPSWEIREKGIWLIGELGKIRYNVISSLFELLVPMFSDEIMIIQTKVVDAFVKIGQNNGPRILQFFIPYMKNTDEDIQQGISDTLIYISLHNKRQMLSELIKLLENPPDEIQKFMTICLEKIYMESPDGVEEEIFRMFQGLNSEDWRERKCLIKLLGNLCYVLKIKSISAWIVLTLKNWQENEKDFDVKDEITESLNKINNIFEDLQQDISDIEQKKKFFYDEMDILQKKPQELRNKTEQMIDSKKFSDAEILLEEESNTISEKINDFEKRLNDSEFRRFNVSMMEDWEDIKEEILESISDVKSFEYNRICEGRSNYVGELEKIIQIVRDRIEILKVEYETAKEMKTKLQNYLQDENTEKTEEFLDIIASIRDKIYNLEFDIGQIWISNLEFKDFMKDSTIFWINTKIEIQQFLAEIVQDFNVLRQMNALEAGQMSNLKQKITFEFLNQEFQNTVLQAIQNQRDVLEKFSIIIKPLHEELSKKKFTEARHILELTLNNLHSSIEFSNREINRIYEEIDKINIPIKDANEIRRYMNHWNEIKDQVQEKIRIFRVTTDDQILINEITEFQRFMNPISLIHLARNLKTDLEPLKGKVFNFITQHQIHAIIRDDLLVQIERPKEERFLAFYRKVNTLGAKLDIAVRIYNPTKFFISDISLNFKYPSILELDTEASDLSNLNIREFEPEATRIIRWTFKINKSKELEKRVDVYKMEMTVSYRNPFNEITNFMKELEIIL